MKLDLTPISLDELGPERVHALYDPKSGMRAFVAIDTTRFMVAGGGTRMASDVSLAEVVRLARAMTLKYAMLEMPCGGAKAGIVLDPSDPSRAEVMAAFLRAIKPLVETGQFMPGPDMGTSSADFDSLWEGRVTKDLCAELFEGMPLESQLTGAGVVAAAKSAWASMSRSLRGATVAIEGFGKVGAGAAKFFSREGARVVAISTVEGALHDRDGLDVGELLALRAEHGDGALARAHKGERVAREALFEVDADILIPGARPDVIHMGNVDRVSAALVVPAANVPYAEGTLARLHQRGVVALPDFVTNAGGILATFASFQGSDAKAAFALVEERIGGNVKLVMDAARESGASVYDAAVQIARKRLSG